MRALSVTNTPDSLLKHICAFILLLKLLSFFLCHFSFSIFFSSVLQDEVGLLWVLCCLYSVNIHDVAEDIVEMMCLHVSWSEYCSNQYYIEWIKYHHLQTLLLILVSMNICSRFLLQWAIFRTSILRGYLEYLSRTGFTTRVEWQFLREHFSQRDLKLFTIKLYLTFSTLFFQWIWVRKFMYA